MAFNSPQNRTNKAMRNAFFAVLSYLIAVASNFITRRIFLNELGQDLLGIESLYKSVISMLSLAELGIGTGLVYLLYKPLAENDRKTIRHILNFYQKAYRIITGIILAAGLVMSFFAHSFLSAKDAANYSPTYIGITFFLYTLDTLAAYLCASQRALIIADQKNYVNNINETIMNLTTMLLQVALLMTTQSFVVYIVVKVLCRLMAALLINRNFRRLYPDIARDKDRTGIPKQQSRRVMRNIRSMLFHKIGGFGVTASGSMIITKFIDAFSSAAYNSYMLITLTINQLISQLFGGITASFGDYLHQGDPKGAYQKFNVLYHINFLLVSFSTTSLFMLLDPFIQLWMTADSLLPRMTTVLIVLHFYINSMRRVVLMVRDSTGLYSPDRYAPLVEFSINVILALVLVNTTSLGVAGVVIAGIVSMVLVPFWIQPIVVYKNVFKRSTLPYFIRYGFYALATVVGCGLTVLVEAVLPAPFGHGALLTEAPLWQRLVNLMSRGILCLIIPNAVNWLLFKQLKETEEIRSILWSAIPAGILARLPWKGSR